MSMLSAIRLILTLTCDHASHLTSDELDRELTRVERVALHAHLMICRNCRRVRRQFEFLRAVMRQWVAGPTAGSPISAASLSPAARQRIKDALSGDEGR